jgi:thymidylate kinase
VKGTPGSGKTSLLKLLGKYVVAEGHVEVHVIRSWEDSGSYSFIALCADS